MELDDEVGNAYCKAHDDAQHPLCEGQEAPVDWTKLDIYRFLTVKLQ
jgi:hypothetical protein